jgi:hypothetical protein
MGGAVICEDKSSRKAQWNTDLHGLLTLEGEGAASLQNMRKTQPVAYTLSHPRTLEASTTLLRDLTVIISLCSYSDTRLNRRF